MKKLSVLLVTTLLVSSCSSSPKESSAGFVPGCGQIKLLDIPDKSTLMRCLDGAVSINFHQLKGPMVINVWGSWCGPCKKEMPVLRAFYEKAKGKVQLIGVDVEEANFDDGRTFVERNGITWPNLYDPDGRSREYFGLGVPVTWFIAADGSVAYKHVGIIKDLDQIVTLTDKHLGVKL